MNIFQYFHLLHMPIFIKFIFYYTKLIFKLSLFSNEIKIVKRLVSILTSLLLLENSSYFFLMLRALHNDLLELSLKKKKKSC